MRTRAEFERWAEPWLAPLPGEDRARVGAAVGLCDALRAGRSGVRHYFESSFNSRDGEGLLKVGHFFNFPAHDGAAGRDLLEFSALEEFFREGGLDRDLRDRVLSWPLASGTDNDCLGLALDYDLKARAFSKLSLYADPKDESVLRSAAPALGIRDFGAAEDRLDRLEFLGVDFFPGGGSRAKLYVRGGSRDALLKCNFGRDGGVESIDFMYCAESRGWSCETVAALAPFSGHRAFLAELSPRLEASRITWVALKDDGGVIEVYFE